MPSILSFARRGRTRRWRRTRAAVGFAVILLAVSMIATGVTVALFNAQSSSQTDTFTAGTVSLTSPGPTGTCTATALVPDGSTTTCSLQVTYTGNLAGFMGLDVLIATSPGAGGENLYNPGATDNPPEFSVTDSNSVTYTLPTTPLAACPSGFDTANACYQTTDLLVSPTAFTASTAPVTFTISVTIPTDNASAYQGGAATVLITAHAVQASNNGTTAGCTAGDTCSGILAWS